MDGFVDPKLILEASTALADDGFFVTLHMSPGTAHGIAPDGLDFATSFLMANIGSDA
jgi:phospholipase/carboxylesterase